MSRRQRRNLLHAVHRGDFDLLESIECHVGRAVAEAHHHRALTPVITAVRHRVPDIPRDAVDVGLVDHEVNEKRQRRRVLPAWITDRFNRPRRHRRVAEDAGDGLAKRGAADVLAARQVAVSWNAPRVRNEATSLTTSIPTLRNCVRILPLLDPVGLLTSVTALMVGISSARTERVSTRKIGGVVMLCIVLSAIVQGTI